MTCRSFFSFSEYSKAYRDDKYQKKKLSSYHSVDRDDCQNEVKVNEIGLTHATNLIIRKLKTLKWV
ncbi:MAG: hypothetical protein HRU26_04660 [Psychroserpens sp.]|nr:hypothetical protein [Psychroserpens sp.]